MAGNLLYAEEHLACAFYVSEHECSFRYVQSGKPFFAEKSLFNQIVFILEGEIVGDFNEFHNKQFRAGECFFLPKQSIVSVTSKANYKLLCCSFDTPRNVCDKLMLTHSVHKDAPVAYAMQPTQIRPQMKYFLDGLVNYLLDKINCKHLHELKQSEMFLIFRWFYPKEELALLFHPMIGKAPDFRSAVLDSYDSIKSVNELAKKLNMSRSAFDILFKQEFNTSPKRWLSDQKAKRIRYYISDPQVTIADVMAKFDFEFPSQFTRFCKAHFGCTPTKLIEEIRGAATSGTCKR